MNNLSIGTARKTTTRTRRRARRSQVPLLERVLGVAEDTILNANQADAILIELNGVSYRVRFRPLDGRTKIIVAVVDTSPALPVAADLRERFGLTEREAEVTRLLAARLTNKEIARSLGVTTYTAERHTERILDKLGINSRRHVQGAIALSA